jgi:hypothetical protein
VTWNAEGREASEDGIIALRRRDTGANLISSRRSYAVCGNRKQMELTGSNRRRIGEDGKPPYWEGGVKKGPGTPFALARSAERQTDAVEKKTKNKISPYGRKTHSTSAGRKYLSSMRT